MKFIEMKDKLNTIPFVLSIYGDDSYILSKALHSILGQINLNYPELNMVTLQGDTSIDDIINNCVTLPFIDEKRVVIIRDFIPTKINNASGTNQTLNQQFTKFVARELDTVHLIFINEKMNPLFDIDSIIKIDCNKLDTFVLIKWICTKFKQNSITISPDDAKLIIEYCSSDMTRISQEVEKLIYSCAKGGNISSQQIEALVSKDLEYSIFDMCNLIANKDVYGGLNSLNQMLELGQEKTLILASIYNTYRRMFFACNSNQNDLELSELLGVKSFAISKAKQLGKKYKRRDLQTALSMCVQADIKSKTDFSNVNDVLPNLVVGLSSLGGH